MAPPPAELMSPEDELQQAVRTYKSFHNKDFAPFASEFSGTFLLCFTVGMVASIDATSIGTFAPLAIGSALMVSVYMGGHISGAHHNPAVTLAVWLAGKQKSGMYGWGAGKCALGYVGAQLLASFVAGLIALGVTEDIDLRLGKPMVAKTSSLGAAFMVELMFTFFLALTVLNVACTRAIEGKSFYGHAIGFIVFVGAVAGGDISGAAFNPAVGTGMTFCSGDSAAMDDIWLYWMAPCMGAALAAYFWKFTVQLHED